MDAKYFTCNYCRFTFTRTVMPEQCPDCGKYAVRPATKEETEEAIARQKEFGKVREKYDNRLRGEAKHFMAKGDD